MASISMGDLKKGLKIEMNGIPYKIVEYQHVKPGKGAAFVRCKVKSFVDGRVIEKTFHAGDKCETPNLEDKVMQFLYDDGEFLQFMDSATYEQIALTHDQVGEAADWIIDGMNVDMLEDDDSKSGSVGSSKPRIRVVLNKKVEEEKTKPETKKHSK